MILSRFVIGSENDMKKAKIYESYNLGHITSRKDIICKKCKIQNPFENIELKNNFWTCQNGCVNKFKDKDVSIYQTFEFDYTNVHEIIRGKFNGIAITSQSNFIVYKNSIDIPIFFFDMPQDSSCFIEGLKNGALFLYVNGDMQKKCITPFNKNNFMELHEFLNMPIADLIKKVEVIGKNSYPLETIKIRSKIANFIVKNHWSSFEKEIARIFDDLKYKQTEIQNLLDKLRHMRENPSGNKFVRIGSNFPADVMPIELFSFVSNIFNVTSNTHYDAKMISKILDFETYKSKKLSNPGSRLVFVTSADGVEPRIWRDVIQARQNNQGEWFYLIMDRDMLSLLVQCIGADNYFN